MRRLAIMLMPAALCAHAGMLEMTVSGPGSEPAGIVTVTETGEPAPRLTGTDSLPLMPGWPIRISSASNFGPARGVALADFDGDDLLDIIAVSSAGTQTEVRIWEAGVPFNRTCWEWPTYQFNMQRTGVYQWAQVGVEERANDELGMTNDRHPTATIVRGVLCLQSEIYNQQSEILLLNSTGRKVMDLVPGENDVRHVAPGVYFIGRKGSRGQGSKGPSAKIVIR